MRWPWVPLARGRTARRAHPWPGRGLGLEPYLVPPGGLRVGTCTVVLLVALVGVEDGYCPSRPAVYILSPVGHLFHQVMVRSVHEDSRGCRRARWSINGNCRSRRRGLPSLPMDRAPVHPSAAARIACAPRLFQAALSPHSRPGLCNSQNRHNPPVKT